MVGSSSSSQSLGGRDVVVDGPPFRRAHALMASPIAKPKSGRANPHRPISFTAAAVVRIATRTKAGRRRFV